MGWESPMKLDAQGRGWPRLRRLFVAWLSTSALVIALAVPAVLVAQPAGAVTGTSASFNVAFARNGTALVLSVVTSNDVDCVVVAGDHSGTQTSNTGQASWTFDF